MKNHFLILLFLVLINLDKNAYVAQNKIADSLFTVLKKPCHDTVKIKTLISLSEIAGWRIGKFDTAFLLATQGKELAQKINYKAGLASAFNNIANVYYLRSNYDEALKNYKIALNIHKERGFIKGIASISNNIGNIYTNLGIYPEALKYYLSALKIVEANSDKKMIAIFQNNIGMIYNDMKNLPEALKYYDMALKIQKELQLSQDEAHTHYNIGMLYSREKKFTEALGQYDMAMKVFEEMNDKVGVAGICQSKGNIYSKQNRNRDALKEFFKSLKIYEEIKYNRGLSYLYNNIGNEYAEQKNYKEALPWLNKGLVLAKAGRDREQLRLSYSSLAKIDSLMGNFKDAYTNYRIHEAYKDSMVNEEASKKIVQTQMRFEFDKKQTADSLIVAEERIVNNVKFQQEKQQRYFLYGGLVIFALFAGFMYNRFKITQKQKFIINNQKTEVEEQKKLVDAKQKEILDSIHYARKIQMAQIPSEKQVAKSLDRLRKI